ncbi:hypothetical protein A0257_01825 [Hymenobacter psoromatis]|nr:hypothetical protein A0257_01825 [Hymenobacter psoromatis]
MSDAVVEQVKRYDEFVQARVLLVTNGIESYAAERDEKGSWRELLNMPTYLELVNKNSLDYLEYEELEYERVDFSKPIPGDILAECFDNGYIGEETNPNLYPIIFNLMGWLFDAKDKILPKVLDKVQLIEDAGIRLAQFGNAGGGAFGTEYRYFILKDREQNNQIISLTITGIMKTVNDPQWGNRNGATILAVAIDDFKSSHMSLELRLDKYVTLEKNTATIWHDGTLTVGKLGQAKRKAVIEYIFSKAPYLINDAGKIILGVFDLVQEIHSNQLQTQSFLENLILYALLRDEYRQLHKKSIR